MSDVSSLFELLTAKYRRQIMFLLCDTERIQLPEGLLTRGETQPRQSQDNHYHLSSVQTPQSTDQSLQRLEIQLHHVDLPKLEDEGVIEWDPETQTVSRGPTFEEIEPALRLLAANANTFPDGLF